MHVAWTEAAKEAVQHGILDSRVVGRLFVAPVRIVCVPVDGESCKHWRKKDAGERQLCQQLNRINPAAKWQTRSHARKKNLLKGLGEGKGNSAGKFNA